MGIEDREPGSGEETPEIDSGSSSPQEAESVKNGLGEMTDEELSHLNVDQFKELIDVEIGKGEKFYAELMALNQNTERLDDNAAQIEELKEQEPVGGWSRAVEKLETEIAILIGTGGIGVVGGIMSSTAPHSLESRDLVISAVIGAATGAIVRIGMLIDDWRNKKKSKEISGADNA